MCLKIDGTEELKCFKQDQIRTYSIKEDTDDNGHLSEDDDKNGIFEFKYGGSFNLYFSMKVVGIECESSEIFLKKI